MSAPTLFIAQYIEYFSLCLDFQVKRHLSRKFECWHLNCFKK